jgi:hypothetical protein
MVGTGKYADWQGTIEFTLQYPKPFPEGTMRGICREVRDMFRDRIEAGQLLAEN